MRRGSVLQNNETYAFTALLACHATFGDKGFKASQFRFFIEVLSNWMSSFFEENLIDLQNTQVIRELENYVSLSILRKEKDKNGTLYFVTSGGLIESVHKISSPSSLNHLDTFFIKYHFLTLYKEKILSMVHANKTSLPKSYIIELRHFMDATNLIVAQKEMLDLEIKKLEKRIDESKKQISLTNTLLKENMNLDEIVSSVAEKYPYELNYQKSMQDLFAQLPLDLKHKELVDAPHARIDTLWSPTLKYLKDFRKQLENLE